MVRCLRRVAAAGTGLGMLVVCTVAFVASRNADPDRLEVLPEQQQAPGGSISSSGDSQDTPTHEVSQQHGLRFGPGDTVEFPADELDWDGPLTIELVVTPEEIVTPKVRLGGTIYQHQGRGKAFHTVVIRSDRRWQFDYKSADETILWRVNGGLAETGRTAHIAAVFDGSQPLLFVDGQKFDPYRIEKLPNLPQRQSMLGGPQFSGGVVRAFRVSRTARYSSDTLPARSLLNLSSDSETIALYDFNGEPGEVLRDISGNGLDGRIVGAQWEAVEPAE
ncbi:hypothetical protein GC176_28330 [bacterium]|nr:hypothetical protein [bacterium]